MEDSPRGPGPVVAFSRVSVWRMRRAAPLPQGRLQGGRAPRRRWESGQGSPSLPMDGSFSGLPKTLLFLRVSESCPGVWGCGMGFLPDVLLWARGPVGRSAPAHSHARAGPTVPAVGGILSAAGRWHRPPALSSAGSAAGPAAGEGRGKTRCPGGRRVLPGKRRSCLVPPLLAFLFFSFTPF